MAHTFFLAPSGSSVGLTSVALGLVHTLDKLGMRVAFFKPIGDDATQRSGPERSTHFIGSTTSLRPPAPVPLEQAERLMGAHRKEELLERVVADYAQASRDADVVIVEGLINMADSPIEDELNLLLVQTLSADVIVVGALRDAQPEDFAARLRLTAERYARSDRGRVVGYITNRVPNPRVLSPSELRSELSLLIGKAPGMSLLGAIAENSELGAVRTADVARHLGARVLHEGDLDARRVRRYNLLARTVPNLVRSLLPGSLLITPADRSDVVLAVAMAAVKNIQVAGLVLTGDSELSPEVLELCSPALAAGLPLMAAKTSSWDTARALMDMSPEIPADDLERARLATLHIADHLDADWFLKRSAAPARVRLSPAAFCYRLVEAAARSGAKIVLPEGNEPRTVKAAIQCTTRKIAHCILLADPKEV